MPFQTDTKPSLDKRSVKMTPVISPEQLKQCKKLLFISPLALGDFLYLKTFLVALKEQNSHIQLDIWLDDNRCDQAQWRLSRSKIIQQWIDSEPAFGQSYGCTDSHTSQQRQIFQAQEAQYDIIICHSASKSAQYSKIARQISPSAFIVSSITKNPYNGLLNKVIFRHSDQVMKLDERSLPSEHHITDRFYSVLRNICGLKMTKENFMPTLKVPDEALQVCQQWLSENFSESLVDGNLVFLNHLSTSTKKDWHLEQLFELVSLMALQNTNNRYIINVTGEKFSEVSKRVAQFATSKQIQIAVFTVKEHFFELPAMISLADIVITVDTAILHFAFATNRPLVSMMRSKKPYWAPPETPTAKVLYATQGQGHVSDIPVEEVFKTLQIMQQHIVINQNQN